MLASYMNANYETFLADLKGTEYAKLRSKFEVLATGTARLFSEQMVKERRFSVHGDAWANNLLFAEEPNVSGLTNA